MDMMARLVSLIPARWASGDKYAAVMAGLAGVLQAMFDLIEYARLQTRLRTVSGLWLDMAAADFLGRKFIRRTAESDDAFRARFLREIFRPRATRAAMASALEDLSGSPPKIFEPWNTGDTGAWGNGTFAWGRAGSWGSMTLRNQAFVTPVAGAVGAADVGGWHTSQPAFSNEFSTDDFTPVRSGGSYLGGWGRGAIKWVGGAAIASAFTQQDILTTINATKPTGVVVWTPITL